jgi:hypothetical protein
MIDSEMLEYVKGLSIEERLHIIEAIWHTINRDMRSAIASPLASETAPLRGTVNHYEGPYNSAAQSQRPAFGFMKDTGSIQGDIISPAVPESDWEALRQ